MSDGKLRPRLPEGMVLINTLWQPVLIKLQDGGMVRMGQTGSHHEVSDNQVHIVAARTFYTECEQSVEFLQSKNVAESNFQVLCVPDGRTGIICVFDTVYDAETGREIFRVEVDDDGHEV